MKALSTSINVTAPKFGDGYDAGDVLYSSWGYDQTNVDFYIVLDRKATAKGNHMLIVAELSATTIDTGPMQGKVFPDLIGGRYGKSLRRKLGRSGVRITTCQTAWKWSGKEMYCSWDH